MKEVAVLGKPTCRYIMPPSKDICGKPATHDVTFGDGDAATMCAECALFCGQMALSYGTSVKVEKLDG